MHLKERGFAKKQDIGTVDAIFSTFERNPRFRHHGRGLAQKRTLPTNEIGRYLARFFGCSNFHEWVFKTTRFSRKRKEEESRKQDPGLSDAEFPA